MRDISIGGDESPYICPNCASPNTVYVEYISNEPDESELGIECMDCDNIVEPHEMQYLSDKSD